MRIVLPLWMLSLLALTACQSSLPHSLSHKKAANLLIPGKTSLAKYELSLTYDPYAGGTFIMADTSFEPGIFFFNNGEFVEYDSYNYYEGKWGVSKDRDSIHFIYQRKNRKGRPEGKQSQALYWDQSYKLLSFEEDSLVIGAQGRHGIVKKIYKRVATDF